MYKALYFISNTLQGESTIPDSGTCLSPHSLAYFCSTCGDVWARVVVTGEDGFPAVWGVEYAPCPRHQPRMALEWGRIPGSLLIDRIRKTNLDTWAWARAIDHLPPQLVEREFILTLNHWQQEQDKNNVE